MNEEKTLLQAISAYVPSLILQRVAANPYAPLDGWQEEANATLLFADISGFTAMSEQLAQLGKEGAEELTRILNAYFSTMIDLVRAHGGFIVKFGGDALTCQFPGDSHGLRHTCACALQMQANMAQFEAMETKAGPFTLRMKIGISNGSVLFLSVGNSRNGLEHVLVGAPLERMAEAEHHAQAGEILVDDTGLACLSEKPTCRPETGLLLGEPRDAFRPLKGLAQPIEVLSQEQDVDWAALERHEERAIAQLMPYIPQNVFEQITAGHRQFVGEHRRVVSLFANFFGLDYANDPEVMHKLQTYFVTMQDIIQQYGGRLNRMITGDKGNLLHIIFGAPVAYEDNEQRAVRCALAMQRQALQTEALAFIPDQRIGVASGYVFAGNVGSERRQEYTVMGDVVNLSARLMQAAEAGQVLLDEKTTRRISQIFHCEAQAPIRVKGKQAPVPVWTVTGARQDTGIWEGSRHTVSPLVGRAQELTKIEGALALAAEGHGQLLVINGEAGVGKSRLLQEVIALARSQGAHGYGGDCLSHGSKTPYLPWIDFFHAFFKLDKSENTSPQDKAEKIQRRMVAMDPALADWVPLIAQILGLPVPDNELTASLNAQLRKQRVFDITLSLLRHQASQAPLLLVFEDVHWADGISLEMLNYIARNIATSPVLLVAIHRPTITLTEWQRYDYYHYIELADLPAQDALALARAKLGVTTLPEQLPPLILRGEERVNPFFVEELINTMVERNYLVPQADDQGYELPRDLSQMEIPGSVHSLVMSRIDRLDESAKLTVKVASVIGRTFEERTLHAIYPVQLSQSRIHSNLERLNTLDLTPLEKPAPEWEYIFKHIITQEVAYESLLYVHRRALHLSIADYIETTRADNLEEHYELLAHHYVESGNRKKSWNYLVQAGDKARARYANDAAIAHYTRALALWPENEHNHQVHEALGDVHQLIGEYDLALQHYRQALDAGDADELHVVSLRRKIARTWSLQGQYDEAEHYLSLSLEAMGDAANAHPEAAHIYNDLGWIALQRGLYEQGLAFCTQGLDIVSAVAAHDPKPQPIQDELLHTLGSIYIRMGKPKQAALYFERCIAARENRGDIYEAGRSYINLAVVHWGQGNFQKTETYIQKALGIFHKVGFVHGMAMAYNNLGVLAYTLGEYAKAIENYHRSLDIRKEIGDVQGIADIYNNLGEVYYALGDLPQALHHLQEATQMFTELGDQSTIIDAYQVLAQVELEMDDIEAARAYGQRALKLAQEIGSPEYVGSAQRVLGNLYRATADLESSRQHLDESVRILAKTDNRAELGRSFYELGLTLQTMDAAQSQRAIEQAATIFEALGMEKDAQKAREALEGPTLS